VSSVFNGQRIALKKDELNQGSNEIDVVFKSAYRHDGTGIHHFMDETDGEEYLYT
jgi:aminopeptidase N